MDGETYTVSTETITPELAALWLQHAGPQRRVRPRAVKRLEREIRSGRWRANGATITFAVNGWLIDGHHRLQAIVNTGITVRALVVRDLQPEVVTTVDTNTVRNPNDHFKVSGQPHHETAPQICRIIHQAESGPQSLIHNRSVDHVKLLEIMADKVWRPTVMRMSSLYKQKDTEHFNRQALWTTRIFGIFAWISGYVEDVYVDDFLEDLIKGTNLSSIDARLLLRERLFDLKHARKTNNRRLLLQRNSRHFYTFIILTWNRWLSGQKTTRLQLSRKGILPDVYGCPPWDNA
jgi:hypothetical protein